MSIYSSPTDGAADLEKRRVPRWPSLRLKSRLGRHWQVGENLLPSAHIYNSTARPILPSTRAIPATAALPTSILRRATAMAASDLPQICGSLEACASRFQTITGRFAAFQAQWLNVHVDFPLLQRLALPIAVGAVRYPGIKIHDPRLIRLFEVLLYGLWPEPTPLRPAQAQGPRLVQHRGHGINRPGAHAGTAAFGSNPAVLGVSWLMQESAHPSRSRSLQRRSGN